jgi:hypothetical protein
VNGRGGSAVEATVRDDRRVRGRGDMAVYGSGGGSRRESRGDGNQGREAEIGRKPPIDHCINSNSSHGMTAHAAPGGDYGCSRSRFLLLRHRNDARLAGNGTGR